MLPGFQSADRELVFFALPVADSSFWRDYQPLPAIQAVLRPLDTRPSVLRGKLQFRSTAAYTNINSLNHWWSVVHLEPLALTFCLQRLLRRIRRRIARRDLQVVAAVRQCGGIKRIKALIQIVLQQLPLFFAFAPEIHRVAQVILIVVVRGPQNGLIPLLHRSLGRSFKFYAAGVLCLIQNHRTTRRCRRRKLQSRWLISTGDQVCLPLHPYSRIL